MNTHIYGINEILYSISMYIYVARIEMFLLVEMQY